MRRPGVAVGTTVLTAAIRIDAGRKANVRTVICRDDRSAGVLQELRGWGRTFRFIYVGIDLIVNRLEAVGGIVRGSSTSGRTLICLHTYCPTRIQLDVFICTL